MPGLYSGPCIRLKTGLKVVVSQEEGVSAGRLCGARPSLPGTVLGGVGFPTSKRGGGTSLTFVFRSVLHCFKSCCLHGLLVADEPVKPPSSQLPELRVAGHEPPRAVPLVQGRLLQRLHAHQQPGTRVGVLQRPGLYDPNPGHPVRHRQGLISGGPTCTLLDNQAGPLQQQEAASHQVSCCQEEEQKLRPTDKLL